MASAKHVEHAKQSAPDNSQNMNPTIEAFFDEATFTISYVVSDPDGDKCAIIDSVLDFDFKAGFTFTDSAERIIDYVQKNKLAVEWILETHAHADHLTAAQTLKKKLGGKIGIGEHIKTVQKTFKKVFNFQSEFYTDGRQFDFLLKDGEHFNIGDLSVEVIHTPGHTPACVTYVIGDAAFVGDTLFMPDYGTARADFPGGDATKLYRSIRKILALPPKTRLFMCHDYMPGGRKPKWETTVAEQRADNIHIHDGIDEKEFVTLRTDRDKTLDMPALILPSIQINLRAGSSPPPEDNGESYLKLPLNAL